MKRKEYIVPELMVVKVATSMMLAASPTGNAVYDEETDEEYGL